MFYEILLVAFEHGVDWRLLSKSASTPPVLRGVRDDCEVGISVASILTCPSWR